MAALASAGALHALFRHHQDDLNLRLMKFFRDLGRYKALQRRMRGGGDGGQHEESKGLLAFLASDTDPLRDLLDLNAEQEDELHLPTYTRAELQQLGNHESPDGTLLLGILGRVYDVTEGDKYYGPSGTYGLFAGHDVTYALATGCKKVECIETDWTTAAADGNTDHDAGSGILDDKQLLEAKKWLSFFHLHDKYPLVGKLEGDSFEALVQQLLEDQDGIDGVDPENLEPPVLSSSSSQEAEEKTA